MDIVYKNCKIIISLLMFFGFFELQLDTLDDNSIYELYSTDLFKNNFNNMFTYIEKNIKE